MSSSHTVDQGEHLASIAAKYGFADFHTIWDHPQNASLKEKRGNPNVIHPGDILFIPDRETKTIARPTEQKHRFSRKNSHLKIRVVIQDISGDPIKDTPCTVDLGSKTLELRTDGKGLLEFDIPPSLELATLIVNSPDESEEIQIPLKIGHLDPCDEISGIQERLNNLGYRAGNPAKSEPEQLRCAIEEFQADHGLSVDGKASPALISKLKEIHGC
jgi:hypothetical protein